MLDPSAQHYWCHVCARITHVLTLETARLMGRIFRTMHCRSQQCWELLRPLARSFKVARLDLQGQYLPSFSINVVVINKDP